MKRRPRRTIEAIAERMTASEPKAARPPKLTPTPEMLTVEYLQPIVGRYQAALRLWAERNRQEYTATGRRKKGKALEAAQALPRPPYPDYPLGQYECRPLGFDGWPGELQDLWAIATGILPHARWDEDGWPLNAEARRADESNRDDRDEYLERRAGRG